MQETREIGRKAQTGLKYKRILLVRLGSSLMEKNRPFAHFSPPLALKYIQSLLERFSGIEVNMLDCQIREWSAEEERKASCDFCPDLLVININSYEFSAALNYVKSLKESLPRLAVIAIGPDAATKPGRYLGFPNLFDIVIPGEPEEEVVDILNELNNGKALRCLSDRMLINLKEGRRPLVADLDSLPFPSYSRYEIERYHFLYPIRTKRKVRWGYLLSSRGCPYRCIFCAPAIRKTDGSKVRLRNPLKIVDEIEYLINRYDVNVVCFQDDNFTTFPLQVESICREILRRRLKIRWVAHARVDEVDYSLLSLMKKSGCGLLRFGVESGSERIISLLKKTDKGGWIERTRLVFSQARRLKIATNALFILGNPTETEEEIMATIKLAKELKPDLVQIHFLTPYPGSQIYEEFKASLGGGDVDQLYHYAPPFLPLSQVNAGRLRELRSLFYRKIFFSPDFLIRHIFNYGFFYLSNRDILQQLLKAWRYLKA